MVTIRDAEGLSFNDVLLVPNYSEIKSRASVDLGTHLAPGLDLALPIISANTPWCTGSAMAIAMATAGGLGIIHRMQLAEDELAEVERVKAEAIGGSGSATTDKSGRLAVGAAVGVTGDYAERARRLVDAGVDVLVIDIAHGHSQLCLDAVEAIRPIAPGAVLIAGNVATARGTAALASAGADVVKVGIGPGGVCTTRLVAGVGVPQLTAVLECAETAAAAGVTTIADGGIRTSGDIVKALAAGAQAVMLGSVLAGCDESAATFADGPDGARFKISTGFASLGMELTLKRARGEKITKAEIANYVAEGVDSTFECRGPAREVLVQLAGGIRSGLSYCGAQRLAEFADNAEFIRVSPSAEGENGAHALQRSTQIHPDYRASAAVGQL